MNAGCCGHGLLDVQYWWRRGEKCFYTLNSDRLYVIDMYDTRKKYIARVYHDRATCFPPELNRGSLFAQCETAKPDSSSWHCHLGH